MSESMTMQALGYLLQHIRSDHSYCRQKNGKYIKYIEPCIDTRTNTCFAISFRNAGEPVVFHTQNECSNLEKSLFQRCMEYLDEPFES